MAKWTVPKGHPVGGAPEKGSVEKWVVKKERGVWYACPLNGDRLGHGWAFSTWEYAFAFAQSGGQRREDWVSE
jgi:hypothetical protein